MKNKSVLDYLSSSNFKKPKKLIFLLHGYGDNAENFIHICRMFNLNEYALNFIAINAPNKILNYPIGKQWFALYPDTDLKNQKRNEDIIIDQSELENSLKKIINTIYKVKNEFKLNIKDCFILGFSQGGMMAYEITQNLTEKFAGVGILSGKIINISLKKNNFFLETPIFISHGDLDNVLPIKNFIDSCNFLKKNNFNFESYLLKGDSHTISNKAIELFQKFIKKNI